MVVSYTFSEVLAMRTMCWILSVCMLLNCVACSRTASVSVAEGIVLIDPGHGGFDGGAVATDGTTEKHLNLAISLCLRDLMCVCGIPVRMTRQTDVGLEENASVAIREKKVSDMHKRLSMYDEVSLVISIHQNHFTIPKYSGTQVFYSPNHSKSVALAQTVRDAVVGWIQPQNTRELKKATDGIFLLYHTTTPAILVECGFLSNPDERELLKNPAYQQQMAFAVLAGYWNYKASE